MRSKELVDALLYRASLNLHPPFDDLPGVLQQKIVRDVAIPINIFIPDTSDAGGHVVVTHSNTDISFLVGVVDVTNKKILRMLSIPENLNQPFHISIGFPVIWFGDHAISCNVIRQVLCSTVEVPLKYGEMTSSGEIRRFVNWEQCEYTFNVDISVGISLTFKMRLLPSQQIRRNRTHITQGTFTVHLIRIQVTSIPPKKFATQ